jgi:predicted nucleotidyltransferase
MVEKTTISLRIINLYRTDYTASLHVRAIAKLLDTSHVTILPYLKQLEQAKILQHEKIGRNKQYQLNKANIITKFYLTAAELLAAVSYLEKNFIIKKLAEHLNSLDTVAPIILFGSYAKNYATEESDIDLFSIGAFTKEQTSRMKNFQATYGKKVNIKTATTENFNAAVRTGDLLTKEIVRNHIALSNPDPFVTILWRAYVER